MQTGKALIPIIIIVVVLVLILGWIVGFYNSVISLNEKVDNQWAQVETQYQRRFDLIPNLVETVKGIAKQEQAVFVGVAEARAKVGQMKITPETLNDAKAFSDFQAAQQGLSQALSRLMVAVEAYPELKSNENFMGLQAQLEGTENRISVERKRFNDLTKDYNVKIKRFPGNVLAGMFNFEAKVFFDAVEGAEKAPAVKFDITN